MEILTASNTKSKLQTAITAKAAGSPKTSKSNAVAPKAKDQAVQAVKAAKEPRQKPQYVLLITKMVSEAKWNRKQIIEAVTTLCPSVAPSSIATVCTDCKNPKYNRLPHLVVADDKGILKFKK